MADDAAGVLRALELLSTHVAGFSMGSAIAQELALRHPELVRSLVLTSTYARPDALWRNQLNFWRWLPEAARRANAPSSRRSSHGSTRRARTPTDRWTRSSRRRWPSPPAVRRGLPSAGRRLSCPPHGDHLSEIVAPTLVLSGELDVILPPRFGRSVAAAIPNASFEVMSGEAHQPFQEVPDEFNARVDAFWRDVEGGQPRTV